MRDFTKEIICQCPNEHLNAQIKSQHFQQTSEMFHTGLKDILFSRVDFIFLQHMDLSYSNAILKRIALMKKVAREQISKSILQIFHINFDKPGDYSLAVMDKLSNDILYSLKSFLTLFQGLSLKKSKNCQAKHGRNLIKHVQNFEIKFGTTIIINDIILNSNVFLILISSQLIS